MALHLVRPLTLGVLLESATDPMPDTGCRHWTGFRDRKGYGKVGYNGRVVLVTRLVMAWTYGYDLDDVPARIQCRHLCHNPCCINPDHLIAGHARDNTRDMVKAGRARGPHSFVDGRCRNGHDITVPGATRSRNDGGRVCEQCLVDRLQERRLRYASDADYRESILARQARHKERIQARRRARYARDPEYRERLLRQNRESRKRRATR